MPPSVADAERTEADSDKRLALSVINGLPDHATMAEIMAELRLHAALNDAADELDEGKGIPHEEVVRTVNSWHGK